MRSLEYFRPKGLSESIVKNRGALISAALLVGSLGYAVDSTERLLDAHTPMLGSYSKTRQILSRIPEAKYNPAINKFREFYINKLELIEGDPVYIHDRERFEELGDRALMAISVTIAPLGGLYITTNPRRNNA